MAEEFQKGFANSKILLVFLGTCPVYLKVKKGILSLSVGEIFDDFSSAFFEPSELTKFLIEAFQMARLMITPGDDKQATKELLNELTKSDVSNLFLFHSTELPVLDKSLPYAVHSIEVHTDAVPVHDSVSICVREGWTHCCIGQCTPDVIAYMHRLVFTSTEKVKMKIKVSPGIELIWISGPRTEKQLQGDHTEIEVTHWSRDLAFMVTTSAASKYKSFDCIGVQATFDYNGYIIVANSTWRKVKTVNEWVDSWNILHMCAMYMKQHSVHALMSSIQKSKVKSLERRLSWEFTPSENSNSPIWYVATTVALFKGLILDDTSPLPVHIRREIMFQVMTHGHVYNSFAATTIMLLRDPHHVIHIPPFIFVPLVNDVDITIPKHKQSELLTSVVHISCELFESIEQHIRSILEPVH